MPETEIQCKFAATGGGKTCEKTAAQFVRAKKTGRLVPLCGPCLGSFKEAQKRLGEGDKGQDADLAYSLVAVGDGAEEYAAQPARVA